MGTPEEENWPTGGTIGTEPATTGTGGNIAGLGMTAGITGAENFPGTNSLAAIFNFDLNSGAFAFNDLGAAVDAGAGVFLSVVVASAAGAG